MLPELLIHQPIRISSSKRTSRGFCLDLYLHHLRQQQQHQRSLRSFESTKSLKSSWDLSNVRRRHGLGRSTATGGPGLRFGFKTFQFCLLLLLLSPPPFFSRNFVRYGLVIVCSRSRERVGECVRARERLSKVTTTKNTCQVVKSV